MNIVYKIFWVDNNQLKSLSALYCNIKKWTKTYKPNRVSRAPFYSLLYAFESQETAMNFFEQRMRVYTEPHEIWKCWSGPILPITEYIGPECMTSKNLELFWQIDGRFLVEDIKAKIWTAPYGTIGVKTITPIEKIL